MTDVKAEIAGFVDRVLTNEAWAETGAEVSTEVMRILIEAGWRSPSTQDETNGEKIATVSPALDELDLLVAEYKAEYDREPPACVVGQMMVALLRDRGWERRQTALLPSEDCDCTPPYADCKHGPEPVDAFDLVRWLHAEASFKLEEARNQLETLGEMVKTCTGHPDRTDPHLPSHAEMIQAARSERDQLRTSTQDETEWEWGYHWPDYERWGGVCQDEAAARFMATQDPPAEVVKRRKAGPWVSVSSVEGDKP